VGKGKGLDGTHVCIFEVFLEYPMKYQKVELRKKPALAYVVLNLCPFKDDFQPKRGDWQVQKGQAFLHTSFVRLQSRRNVGNYAQGSK